jgi:hypothetical protein
MVSGDLVTEKGVDLKNDPQKKSSNPAIPTNPRLFLRNFILPPTKRKCQETEVFAPY